MGMTISGQKDTYIQSEIEKNIDKIEEFKQDTANGVVHKDIDQLLKTLSLLSLYEERSVYRKSAPMVVQACFTGLHFQTSRFPVAGAR
jgi:hypothetical protein